jgi:hypothetical protein
VRITRDPVTSSTGALRPPVFERQAPAVYPTPLLGDFASTPAPTPPATGAIRPVTPQVAIVRAGADSTEVHVHIGRIEVTALNPPSDTPLRRRDRAARQTMPLSDYLAKRRSS